MEYSTEELLSQAASLQKKGQSKVAEKLYEEILKVQPEHPDANHSLALLRATSNRLDASLELFQIAVVSKPKEERFWFNYITCLINTNHFERARNVLKQARTHISNYAKLNKLESHLLAVLEANGKSSKPLAHQLLDQFMVKYRQRQFSESESIARTVTEQYPEYAVGWKLLGATLIHTQQSTSALEVNKKALSMAPEDPEIHNNLASIYKELEDVNKAESHYLKAIELDPRFVAAHRNWGNLLKTAGRYDESEKAYQVALELEPGNPLTHQAFAELLYKQERLKEAENAFRLALEFSPQNASICNNLGMLLKELGMLDESESFLNKAIALQPDCAEFHLNLAGIVKSVGEFAAAEQGYRRAISLNTDSTEAYRLLSLIKKLDINGADFAAMQNLYQGRKLSELQRSQICFSLAKVSEDNGVLQQAYRYYCEGNALRKKLLGYDIKDDINRFDRLKKSYFNYRSHSLPQSLDSRVKPIFILGMNRSGTTLVEQIISSHSSVTGAGELRYANSYGRKIALGEITPDLEVLKVFQESYLNKIALFSDDTPFVTDKMPANFQNIGLISAALPGTKIVHVIRDPKAVCWSNYKQYFTSSENGFSFDLQDLAEYYALYQDLMTFWNEQCEIEILHIHYEDLVGNCEQTIKKLIEFLGLDWEEQCLSPENNLRNVFTASNLQIRKGIYQGSSDKWREFEPYMNGALNSLE